jgi:N-acetylglucosamine-6-sulfatase
MLGLLLLAAIVATGGCFGGGSPPKHAPPHARRPPVPPPRQPERPRPPNVVFVLTDDLAWNLVRHMPHVRQMQKDGVTFSRYFVTDSLCCPSRASILTGRLPHDTRVFTNTPPGGGFRAFHRRREEASTFATALRGAGYGTALMGKYLNGYKPRARLGTGVPFVAPGWSDWDVTGNGYPEFSYRLNTNGAVSEYGHRPTDYLTDVIAERGLRFIRDSAAEGRPFLLELATFAPHAPYTPAPRDARDFPGLRVPRTPSFNAPNTEPPAWLAPSVPLRRFQIRSIDRAFRRRAQAVQAVDLMLANVERTLKQAGVADNTYVVFSSDNGLHMGEHRLLPGKLTAFDSDIRVPLIVTGPHVPHGRRIGRMVENIDLAPTFTQLGRTRMAGPKDGRSLAPLIHGRRVRRWRNAVLIEHRGPVRATLDPDLPGVGAGNPISYEAVRLAHSVYVEYVNGEREYYDLRRDPHERHNTVRRLGRRRLRRLHRLLGRLERCHGARSCWTAAHTRLH